MSNIFGNFFKITVFGESHGCCIGVIIQGCPPGLHINLDLIQRDLDRRKPGQSVYTTQRKEDDKVEILSGVTNGKATGAPISLIIRNKDVDSSYYDEIRDTPRPGHADYTAFVKFKGFNDYRGGGIFSGRMTAAIVMAGSVAKQILSKRNIMILTHVLQIGKIKASKDVSIDEIKKNVPKSVVNCADLELSKKIEEEILNAKQNGDSMGGLIECRVTGVPVGIGEPIFDSIESVLSHGIFSIPGVKGIEYGSGFNCVEMNGSKHNDQFIFKNGRIVTKSNNAGGILGGISNGMPIIFRVAIKPTSSISINQKTVNLKTMKECDLKVRGRHDPCIAIRAVPVVESITAISLVDLIMRASNE